MIKVTIETGKMTEVIWVDSIDKIAQVNTSTMRYYLEQVKDYSEQLLKLNEKAMHICEEEADGALDKLQGYIDMETETNKALEEAKCSSVDQALIIVQNQRELLDNLDEKANHLGYEDIDELVDKFEELDEKLDDLDRTASGLGYDDAETALGELDNIKTAMSDIYDIARQYE